MQKNKHIVQILATTAILLGAAVSYSYVHASTPQLYQYQPLTTIPIGTNGYLTQVGQNVNPASYIQNLYVIAFSIGTVIAVVVGVWSGVSYMLSESVTNKSNSLGRIKNVGWGFALLLCSYTILDIINPQLVNFNLNLGTIDTGVQQGNLSAQEAAQAVLQANADTAAQQAQTDTQTLATAQASLQTANTTVTNDKTTLTLLQNQLNALGPISTPPTVAQSAAQQAVTLAQQQLNTDTASAQQAQTTVNHAQLKSAVSNSASATTNAVNNVNKLLTNATGHSTDVTASSINNTIQKIQDTNNAATAQLVQNLNTAEQLNDQSTVLNLQAQNQVLQASTNQATAVAQASNVVASDNQSLLPGSQIYNNIQAALTVINQGQQNATTLTTQGQTAAGTSLNNTSQASLATLNTYTQTTFGCAANQIAYAPNSYNPNAKIPGIVCNSTTGGTW